MTEMMLTRPAVETEAEAEPAAVAWAREHAAFNAFEPVRDNDWSQTYRLATGSGRLYLKVVPGHRALQMGRAADIARRFPAQVPQVLAFDAHRGWLLTADHGGEDLDEDVEEQLETLLDAAADMQLRALAEPGFLASLDRFDPTAAPGELLDFLERKGPAQGSDDSPLGAAEFIGEPAAQRYLRLLRPRMGLLRAHVATAAELPDTLVHGDLHSGNAAIRADGACVLYDWDECAAGPAGASMHDMFDGCTKPAILLSRWAASGEPMDTPEGRLLAHYVRRLEAGGYASRSALLSGMAGATCAGQIRFITTYGQFPHSPTARHAARSIRLWLDNLLDLCDWLGTRDPASAMAFADDYEAQQEWARAQRLLQDQVARAPERADLCARYARLARLAEDAETAEEASLEAIRLEPEEGKWHLERARVCLDRLDIPAARGAVQAALARGAGDAARVQSRLEEVADALEQAATPQGWPRVRVSAEERENQRLAVDTRALLLQLFRRHGVVQIDDVFDPARVEALQQRFLKRYEQEMDERRQDNHLKVGDRRWMITLALDEDFGAPELVASGLLMPAMRQLLGKECILSAYTAVISLPGSKMQQLHKDHTPLYDELGWDADLPCYAAQIIMPLVQMDEATGTTRCFKDTQRITYDAARGLPHIEPVVPLGSCLLLDYATVHQGLPNRSDRVRPIVALAYSRPWFRDIHNHYLQPPMKFSSTYYENAPEAVRKLIKWRHIEKQVGLQDQN